MNHGLPRVWAVLVAFGLAALALAACASSGNTSAADFGHLAPAGGRSTHGVRSTGASPSGSASSSDLPSALPSGLPSAVSGTNAPPVTSDFTGATYRTPSGFAAAAGFAPAVALTSGYRAAFLTPTDEPNGRDVLSVIVYPLPTAGSADTSTQQQSMIRSFDTRLKASVSEGIMPATVAGHAGWTEGVQQPPDYVYVTYFLFGPSRFLQVSCQVDQEETKISDGCATLLSSLRLQPS